MTRIAAFRMYDEDKSAFAGFENAAFITRFDTVYAFDPDEVSSDDTVYCTKVMAYPEFNAAFDSLPLAQQDNITENTLMDSSSLFFLSRHMKREDAMRMLREQNGPCKVVDSDGFDRVLMGWLADSPL